MKDNININKLKIVNTLGHECIVCQAHIEISDSKQICNECLEALKSLILERRVTPKK